MKRTSSFPAIGVITGSDTYPAKKQRTMQENSPGTTAMPEMAEKMTTEIMGGEAASDSAGHVSDSGDDSSISDSSQWPPENDKESLPDQEQQSYLCGRCREIDFDEILSRKGASAGGDQILSLSDDERVLRDPACAFCQAIQFIYPALDTWDQTWDPPWREPSRLVAATVEDLTTIRWSTDPLHVEGRIALTFTHHFRNSQALRTLQRCGIEPDKPRDLVGYLAEEQTIDSDYEALPASSVNARVDLGLIKRKLDECRVSHSRCRNWHRGGVLGMRLIDCKTRTIVPAPKRGCTYAAISYVWGTPKTTSESRPVSTECQGELPADLPNTITDAMLVALKLKIRYLWCDRYCIRQNPRNKEEKAEKHGQIARMCDIYNGATITIIAAAGDGPDYGLPGVSRKRQPPRVRVGSRTLVATLADPKALIDYSRWSTRGWTFQEGLLARRRLVFTDQQVYFQCGESGIYEAYDKSGEMIISIDCNKFQDNLIYPYFFMGQDDVPDIWSKIDEYVDLTLGNTQDILNGFLGILKHYEEVAYKGRNFHARSVAGLPIDSEQDDERSWPLALFVALGWQCYDPGRRRDGFPSWSWIGWHCKGFLGNKKDTWQLPDIKIGSPFVRLEGPNNEVLEQDELHRLIEARHDFSDTKFLRITAPSLEARVVPYTTGGPNNNHFLLGFDNNEDRLAVRYTGFKHDAFINLSDVLLRNASVSPAGIPCFGIILGENTVMKQFINGTFPTYAVTLIVVEKDGGFERIGVSTVDSDELGQIGSTVREFRLM